MVSVIRHKRDVKEHDAGVDREVNSLPLRQRFLGPRCLFESDELRDRDRNRGGLRDEAPPGIKR